MDAQLSSASGEVDCCCQCAENLESNLDADARAGSAARHAWNAADATCWTARAYSRSCGHWSTKRAVFSPQPGNRQQWRVATSTYEAYWLPPQSIWILSVSIFLPTAVPVNAPLPGPLFRGEVVLRPRIDFGPRKQRGPTAASRSSASVAAAFLLNYLRRVGGMLPRIFPDGRRAPIRGQDIYNTYHRHLDSGDHHRFIGVESRPASWSCFGFRALRSTGWVRSASDRTPHGRLRESPGPSLP